MQTIQLNGVLIHNVPTTEGLLTVEVANDLNRLSMLAGLYTLNEVDYSHLFLTEAQVIEGECPHCQGAMEIRIPQTRSNEDVLVPCVCSDEFVTPIPTDIGNTSAATAGTSTEVSATVATPTLPNNANVDQMTTHILNQIALMRTLGYDFTAKHGQPSRFYQFIVMGDDSGDAQATELTKMLSVLSENATVYSLGLNYILDANAEFEVPRILTKTDIAIKRMIKDLKQVRDIQSIVDTLELDFTRHTSVESQDIKQSPAEYQTSELLLTTFVRVLSTMGSQQNAHYIVYNNEGEKCITNTYYQHSATGETYLLSQYFTNQDTTTPSNFTIVKEAPTEGERVITTDAFTTTVTNFLADLESADNASLI